MSSTMLTYTLETKHRISDRVLCALFFVVALCTTGTSIADGSDTDDVDVYDVSVKFSAEHVDRASIRRY